MSVFIYLWIWYLKVLNSIGIDENRYLQSLVLFKEGNYFRLFENGFSIPYLLLNILVGNFVDDNLQILRVSSYISGFIILTIAIILTCKIFRIKSLLAAICIIYILNLFALRPDVFIGLNEYLKDMFGCLIFFFLIKKTKLELKHLIFIGILFGFAILTRPMSISFFLVFILSGLIFKLISTKKLDTLISYNFGFKGFVIISSCICTIAIMNSYSLLKYEKLVWENKELPGEVNWAQYDYYNVIQNYNGELDRGKHSSVNDTKEYLKRNGKESLPDNFFAMIYFNWQITIYEFFIDYFTSLKYLIRLTGIAYIFGLIYLFKKIFLGYKSEDRSILFFLLFTFIYPLSISFIVISNIQPRWFMFFLPISICVYFFLFTKIKSSRKLIYLATNNLFLLIANLPFITENLEILN